MLIFQNDILSGFTTTVLTIPLTTNLRRASLPSCVLISKSDGGLLADSVALCHQLRVIDKIRLQQKLGTLSQETLTKVESCILFTMDII